MRLHSSSSSALGAGPGSSRLYLLEAAAPAAGHHMECDRPFDPIPCYGNESIRHRGDDIQGKRLADEGRFRIKSYIYSITVVVIGDVETLKTVGNTRQSPVKARQTIWINILADVGKKHLVYTDEIAVARAQDIHSGNVEIVETTVATGYRESFSLISPIFLAISGSEAISPSILRIE